MANVLISAGPTRQYIDPVRYITNGSSGRMGCALAESALEQGHDVTIVSGPVSIQYPDAARVISVVTTEEMLDYCCREFSGCDGMIGTAAPCDYRPITVSDRKIKKTGEPLILHLVETPDVVATLGKQKRRDQWVVGFALETDDAQFQAVTKLHKKCCDLVVLNGPRAIDAATNNVEVINADGQVIAKFSGSKSSVARAIFLEIQKRLVEPSLSSQPRVV